MQIGMNMAGPSVRWDWAMLLGGVSQRHFLLPGWTVLFME